MDSADDWNIEVRRRLRTWFFWISNISPNGGRNPIAAMMKRAEGELPGSDISVPKGMTIEIESVEKAVARMRDQHPILRRLLIDAYVHGKFMHDMAADRRWSDEKTRRELARAEGVCGRFMIQVDAELNKKGIDISEIKN